MCVVVCCEFGCVIIKKVCLKNIFLVPEFVTMRFFSHGICF